MPLVLLLLLLGWLLLIAISAKGQSSAPYTQYIGRQATQYTWQKYGDGNEALNK